MVKNIIHLLTLCYTQTVYKLKQCCKRKKEIFLLLSFEVISEKNTENIHNYFRILKKNAYFNPSVVFVDFSSTVMTVVI